MSILWRESIYLWLLPAIAALAFVLVVLLRRRVRLLAAFAEEGLARRLSPEVDRRRRRWRMVLRIVALALIAIALADPKWGFHWQEVKRKGIDLIVAVDTSRSMLATDVKPNRLERAKLAVMDLVDKLHGDRVGLVAFAGTAFLECPLTIDYAAFERSLRAVEVGLIPRGGTSLTRAIETGLQGFDAHEGRHEALIIITDGEDHEGNAEDTAKKAAEDGVKIYTVGIGTTEGDLLPLAGGGFVKDRHGQVVKSRLDEDTLEKIALASGGAYVHGSGASMGLDELFRDHIDKMEKREVASDLERRYEDRFQIPLAAGLLLLLGETLIGDRRRERKSARRWWRRKRVAGVEAQRSLRAAAVLLLLVSPTLVGWFDPQGDRAAEGNRLYAQGKYSEAISKYGDGLVDAPESPLLQYNLGTALYKEGKYSEAIASLSKVVARGEDQWTGRAAYNLGNAYYKLAVNSESSDPQAAIKDYEEALTAYKRAMAIDPSDRDPKYNHELAAAKLAELRKRLEDEQKKKQEEQKKQDQQKQDQQQNQQQDQQKQDQQQQNGQDQQQQQDQQQKQGEQQQDQQQQAQQQQQQAQQQQEQQQQQQQQQQEAGQQQQQQQAEQQQEQQAGAGEEGQQPQAGEQGAQAQSAVVGDEKENADRRAAQAVLDTAREEELGPEDMRRQMGVAGVGEPAQDW
jgi:Ca-activated chloride channel homolog